MASLLLATSIATLGAMLILFGYRLFCDVPVRGPRGNPSWAAMVLLNLAPGALLALAGVAILTAEARTVFTASHRPGSGEASPQKRTAMRSTRVAE